MKKDIVGLTDSDLKDYPVWCFYFNESGQSDTDVTPASIYDIEDMGEMIVKTIFFATDGSKYLGYIYWENSSDIASCKPHIWFENQWIPFHHGGFPASHEIKMLYKLLEGKFPIKFKSEHALGLKVIEGIVEGLYHYNLETSKTCLIKRT